MTESVWPGPAAGKAVSGVITSLRVALSMWPFAFVQNAHRLTVQPSCIKFGQMREYQLQGLNWLIHLYD